MSKLIVADDLIDKIKQAQENCETHYITDGFTCGFWWGLENCLTSIDKAPRVVSHITSADLNSLNAIAGSLRHMECYGMANTLEYIQAKLSKEVTDTESCESCKFNMSFHCTKHDCEVDASSICNSFQEIERPIKEAMTNPSKLYNRGDK